jgi:hypothetical protein
MSVAFPPLICTPFKNDRSCTGCLENFSRHGRGHRFEMHAIAQVLDP